MIQARTKGKLFFLGEGRVKSPTPSAWLITQSKPQRPLMFGLVRGPLLGVLIDQYLLLGMG